MTSHIFVALDCKEEFAIVNNLPANELGVITFDKHWDAPSKTIAPRIDGPHPVIWIGAALLPWAWAGLVALLVSL